MATVTSALSPIPLPTTARHWTLKAAPAPIRILSVDACPLVLEGLASLINQERGMSVVAQATTGAEALSRYREYRPDIVTLDLLLPDMSGEQLVSQLLADFPNARVVVITSAKGDARMLGALNAGVKAYALKGMSNGEVVDVIRRVHCGHKVIPHAIASTLAEHVGDEALTPRETQILRLVAQGNRNKQVAALLSIADETVRMHMKNILGKLSANDRTHAVTIALTRGVIQL